MAERNQWRLVADQMFDAFGDVSFPSSLQYEDTTQPKVYDAATGKMSHPVVTVQTKAFWTKGKARFNKPDLFTEKDRIAKVRGSDFSSEPSPGAVFTDEKSVRWKVVQVLPDSAGIGAYYDLHVRA